MYALFFHWQHLFYEIHWRKEQSWKLKAERSDHSLRLSYEYSFNIFPSFDGSVDCTFLKHSVKKSALVHD